MKKAQNESEAVELNRLQRLSEWAEHARQTREKTTTEVFQTPSKRPKVSVVECLQDFEHARVRWVEYFITGRAELLRGANRLPLSVEVSIDRNPQSDGYRVSLQVTGDDEQEIRAVAARIKSILARAQPCN